jgi:hypothetical protein
MKKSIFALVVLFVFSFRFSQIWAGGCCVSTAIDFDLYFTRCLDLCRSGFLPRVRTEVAHSRRRSNQPAAASCLPRGKVASVSPYFGHIPVPAAPTRHRWSLWDIAPGSRSCFAVPALPSAAGLLGFRHRVQRSARPVSISPMRWYFSRQLSVFRSLHPDRAGRDFPSVPQFARRSLLDSSGLGANDWVLSAGDLACSARVFGAAAIFVCTEFRLQIFGAARVLRVRSRACA